MGVSSQACSDASVAAFQGIFKLIEGAHRIAISGHTAPDGDALGCVLGLGLAIRERYPEKDVSFLLADDAPVPRILAFMAGADELTPACRYQGSPDLFISVDVPTVERLKDAGLVLLRSRHVACFDHHPARQEFADIAVRRTDCSACGVIIERFLAATGFTLTSDVATCLLCGIVTDTGRFQYQNADPLAFHVASKLVAHGAEPARIALEVYQSQRLEYLHLESVVMGRIASLAHGRVAYSYSFAGDLARFGVGMDECDGLVDVVRSVGGVEVCLFLKEAPGGGEVRGNLRSKGPLSVSGIAERFGGGGHAAAAGFTYHGTVAQALDEILPLLVQLVGEDPTGVCCQALPDGRLVPFRSTAVGRTSMLSAGNTGMFPRP